MNLSAPRNSHKQFYFFFNFYVEIKRPGVFSFSKSLKFDYQYDIELFVLLTKKSLLKMSEMLANFFALFLLHYSQVLKQWKERILLYITLPFI